MLYDVWALTKINDLLYGSGDHKRFIIAQTGVYSEDNYPPNTDSNYYWERVGYRILEDDANRLVNQYP